MAANSKIEWTDHTFNPWIGCSKVHDGCTRCYAEAFAKRTNKAAWGVHGTRVKTSEANWKLPVKWNRWAADGVCLTCEGKGWVTSPNQPQGLVGKLIEQCKACGHTGKVAPYRARVFCASLADVFEDWAGVVLDHKGNPVLCHGDGHYCPPDHRGVRGATLDDVRRWLFAVIDQTPHLDWLLLTKRPENVLRMWPKDHWEHDHRRNVHLGTSISNQTTADKMIGELVKCRDLCAVLFLSGEPLLGPIDLNLPWIRHPDGTVEKTSAIDQVIIGNESSGSRVGRLGVFETEDAWWNAAESMVDQCATAGVAAFVKQVPMNGRTVHEIDRFPPKLRVRQFPALATAERGGREGERA